MIIQAALTAVCTIHFSIIVIKGKLIIHIEISITTIQVVPGIHTDIHTGIQTPTGIQSIITATTGGIGKPC